MYDTKKRNSMAKHNNTGKWGEDLAADYLREKGYEIIERDWRDGHRDIDIIARTPDSRTVVFVGVKTRTQDIIMRPEDDVTEKKIRNIGLAANNYVKMFDVVDELRFDLVTIVGENPKVAKVEHIADAFNPLLFF